MILSSDGCLYCGDEKPKSAGASILLCLSCSSIMACSLAIALSFSLSIYAWLSIEILSCSCSAVSCILLNFLVTGLKGLAARGWITLGKTSELCTSMLLWPRGEGDSTSEQFVTSSMEIYSWLPSKHSSKLSWYSLFSHPLSELLIEFRFLQLEIP